ncbi:MAG TPA: hypothetical protein VJS92_08440 [Candidatus Polarisedimenticolaceae bacterium]|nr:hypothetical protein [Candidatus Polarisedimenticolaceae bacterium]
MLAASLCCAALAAPAVEAWRQDLRFLASELPRRHWKAFFKQDREVWNRAIDELDAALPQLDDDAALVGVMRVTSLLGDAHTAVATWERKPPLRDYPIVLRWFSDGVRVIAAPADRPALVGARLTAIGARTAEEAWTAGAALTAGENVASVRDKVPRLLTQVEIVHGLGLGAAESATYHLQTRAGDDVALELQAPAAGTPPRLAPAPAAAPGELALRRLNRQLPYWWRALEEQHAVYIAYNSCTDDRAHPFGELVSQVLQAIDAQHLTCVVLDVRRNPGGNSAVIQPLLRGLEAREAINRRGGLYVLVGRATYSSAHDNALEFRRKTHALLVGEPTGCKPNSPGEVKRFTLPRSGLTVTYSTKFYALVEGDPPSLEPDIAVDETIDDVLAGRDPALAAALARRTH